MLGGCSVAHLVFTGQILGNSGKIRGMFMESFSSNVAFVSGLVAGGALVRVFAPSLLQPPPSVTEPGIALRMIVGGVAIGLGTSMANGCTSGHGLTGLSRFSVRSLIAVCSFLGSGIVFGTLMGSAQAFPPLAEGVAMADLEQAGVQLAWLALGGVVLCFVALAPLHRAKVVPPSVGVPLAKFLILTGFGMGLCLSGMAMPGKLAGFLDVQRWDPSLLFVLGGAHLLKTPLMQLWVRVDAPTEARPRPVYCQDFECRGSDRSTIDFNLVVGAVIFGFGWALTGLCPGPAVVTMVTPPSVLSGEMATAVLVNVCFVLGGCLHKCLIREALWSVGKKSK